MPRCKNCKETFEKLHFKQQYCFKPDCTSVWINKVNSDKDKARKRQFRKQESESIPGLQKTLKGVFHRYIRLRDRLNGCISCNIYFTAKYDAGHYWNSNNHANVRYNPDNVHGQCVACNQHKHGNLLEYQIRLIKKIGKEKYDYLESIRHIDKKWTKEELDNLIQYYEAECKKFSTKFAE